MSKLYFELLDRREIDVLKILRGFANYGVLGGGTALMLQFSHRKSYDFDIFVPKLIHKQFVYSVKKHFQKIEILTNTGDELSFISLAHKLKISFIYYPFTPLFKTITTPYLRFFHWKDVALDKAYTIGRRGEWRDYVDFYFALKAGFPLRSIMKRAEKKFGSLFSEKLFLAQLTYFGDLKDFTVDFIGKKVSRQEIQNFFEKEVERYKEEIL